MAVIVTGPAAITVDYEELILPVESPTEESTLTSFKATRALKCSWADRRLLSQQLKGTFSNSGGNLIVTTPQSYPDVPAALVQTVAIAPFGTGSDETLTQTKWTDAILTVQYSTSGIANSIISGGSNVVTTEDLEPWADYLTLPNNNFYWKTTGQVLDDAAAPGKITRGMTWVYRTHFQQTVPQSAIDLLDTVNANDATSLSLGLLFEAETLLFNPPRLAIDTDIAGNRAITVEYRFNHRPSGWNKFWNPDIHDYDEITDSDGNIVKIYPTSDFTTIIG